MQHPSITIIIPTYNRATSLKRFLQALDEAEKPEAFQLETIIINNGSTDQTQELLRREQKRDRPFLFEVLDEPHRGKANAVNRGLQNSRGDLILIFDDDMVMHPQCLIRHVECHGEKGYDAVQGRILPGHDPAGNQADIERLKEYNIPILDYGEKEQPIAGLLGTNISFTRELFEKVGLFDPRLGPGAAGYSEDTEYSQRIQKTGLTIGYAPLAIAYHELDPARYGRTYNLTAAYRKGMSRSVYRRDSILLKVVPNLFANFLRYLIYKTLRKPHKVYKTEGRIAKHFGYVAGRLKNGLWLFGLFTG